MKTIALLFAPLGLAAAAAPSPGSGGASAGLGESLRFETMRVTPVMLLEDSRCPAGKTCVWAGRVRVAVRIGIGKSLQVREFTAGKPVEIGGGTLELVEVEPATKGEAAIPDRDYRFHFRFTGKV